MQNQNVFCIYVGNTRNVWFPLVLKQPYNGYKHISVCPFYMMSALDRSPTAELFFILSIPLILHLLNIFTIYIIFITVAIQHWISTSKWTPHFHRFPFQNVVAKNVAQIHLYLQVVLVVGPFDLSLP